MPSGPITRTPARITLPAARRIALAAQGFLDPRPEPGQVTVRHLNRVIHRVGVVQIDSVNVLTRSHYLPFFSRLGVYDRATLDRLRDRAPRRLTEYWAHEASLIPPSTWPLLGFRMERAKHEAWGGMRRVHQEHPELVDAVLDEVRRRGPLTARECDGALSMDVARREGAWGWNWSAVKTALEYLFWAGQITSAGRTTQFERRYVTPDKVLPSRANVDPETAHLELMRIATRAHGIGTARCLRDYFRLGAVESGRALDTLVASGELEMVEVPEWPGLVYLDPAARRPRKAEVESLVSPFDSLVWQRERTQALFGMRYRLEIYTPAQQRLHGYYVLPFVFGDTLVARVDLKADRVAGALIVKRCTWERDAPANARAALDRQLRLMADWLELDGVIA
ncbi:winged helix-turn-helix domain-containing protein [Kocuria sp. JC486]|nr:crosslink repair DNA glycosylase YcaQ family protein [Kocuria sp. JC486]NHU85485.1 winged helix-turn-helix domain-containing protein [Kocuria sp. JC486]